MPDMDGFELTQAIRSEERHTPRKRTPVIAITTNALKGEAERCLASLCERLEQAANRQDWQDIGACAVALPECSRVFTPA